MGSPDFSLDVPTFNGNIPALSGFIPSFKVTDEAGNEFLSRDQSGSLSWTANLQRISNSRIVLSFVHSAGSLAGFSLVFTVDDETQLQALPFILLPAVYRSNDPKPLFIALRAGTNDRCDYTIGLARNDSNFPVPSFEDEIGLLDGISWIESPVKQRIFVHPGTLAFQGQPIQDNVTSDHSLDVAIINAAETPAIFQDGTGIFTMGWKSTIEFCAGFEQGINEPGVQITYILQLPEDAPAGMAPGKATLGYELDLQPEDSQRAGFCIVEPEHVTELNNGRLLFQAPPTLHIRRPVSEPLHVGTINHRYSVNVPDPIGTVSVQGKKAQLTLNATTATAASGPILLEDEYDYFAGHMRIYGGIHCRVGLSFPETAEPARLLWDSATASPVQSVSVVYGPAFMRVYDVIVADHPNHNQLQSFALMLTIDDPNVAEFFMTDVSHAGVRSFTHDLAQVIRAKGPGETTLRIQAVGLAEPLLIDQDEYAPSSIVDIPISVPQPLEVNLSQYSDAFYSTTGSPAAAQSLAAMSSIKVICDHGELAGEVKNHRLQSTSERVTLSLDTPAGPRLDDDLLHPSAFNGTNFTTAIEQLALDASNGDNLVTVEAWKPINDLCGGPSRKTLMLEAVPPTASGLTNSSTDTVVRRNIGDVGFTYSKALSARLTEVVASSASSGGQSFNLGAAQQASFAPKSVTLNNVSLNPVPGDHTLRAVASNDFDSIAGESLVIHAPRPQVSTVTNDWVAQPFRERTRVGIADDIGHLNTSVSAPFAIRYGLSASVTDTSGQFSVSLNSDPMTDSHTTLRLPHSGDLPVGISGFTVTATNEFGSRDYVGVLSRRGLVFDCQDGQVSIFEVPHDQGIMLRITLVALDGTVTVQEQQPPGTILFFSFSDSPAPLGFLSISVEPFVFVEKDDDGDGRTDRVVEEPASTDISYEVLGLVTDPDYFHLTPYIVVDPELEVDDPENIPSAGDSNKHPGMTFWQRVRVSGSAGSQSFPVDFLQQNF